MNWPFNSNVEKNKWVSVQADGFDTDVTGCVYEGAKLDGGIPIGGLGTGYLTLEGTGKIGYCSIYNDIVPPKRCFEDWLTVKVGRSSIPLSTASVSYWGHYPVADLTAGFSEVPVNVGIRAFSPFIVGNSQSSNTPAGLFEIRIKNIGEVPLELTLCISMPAPPTDKAVQVKLSGEGLAESRDNSGKANASFILAGGEQKSIRFVFTWYMPNWRDSGNEAHVHYYGVKYANAAAVADYALSKYDLLLKKVLGWQKEIYDTDFPVWMKDALIQGFYSMAKNTVWIAKTRHDEWWDEKTGWFTHNESHTGCPVTETMVCRMHGHFPALLFFPELEMSTLEAFRHFQISDGEIPFSYGMQTAMRDPRYHCQHPLNSGQYAQMVYRLYKRTGDKEILKKFYTSARKAIEYQYSLDDDGDGLVNEQAHLGKGEFWPANQFYDIWPWWGTSAYVAGTWLATLAIGKAIASEIGDTEFEAECEARLERGLKAYDEKLWTGSYYRLWYDPDNMGESDVSLGNQLMSEWCLHVAGLEGVLPDGKAESALNAIRDLNMAATRYGLVNGVTPDGERYDAGFNGGDHGKHVFIGENLCAAMTFMYKGHREVGMEITKRLYESMALKSCSPWNQRCLISSESGMPVWGDDYYSNMVVWALPAAIGGKGIEEIVKSGELIDRMIKAAAISD